MWSLGNYPTRTAIYGLMLMAWPPRPLVADEPAAAAWYTGAEDCRSCHGNQTASPHGWIQQTELRVWDEEDAHRQAFSVLTEDRSLKMLGRLSGGTITGFEAADPDLQQACLACHALPDKRSRPHARAALHERFRQDEGYVPLSEGVSCEACHGPADAWIGEHWRDDWRCLTPAEKAERGMWDLRDAYVRAEQCTSCHVGDLSNLERPRLITHAMYAAGHPPLTGIEMQGFARSMPPHWLTMREKRERDAPLGDQSVFREQIDAQLIQEHELLETRSLLVGDAIALRAVLQLVESQAEEVADDPQARWPELALFDCYGCHHDLRDSTWRRDLAYASDPPALRQHRRPKGPWRSKHPGRVFLGTWAGAVILNPAVATWAGQLEARPSPFPEQPLIDLAMLPQQIRDLETALTELRALFGRYHFGGPPAELAKRAGAAADAADAVAQLLNRASVPPSAGQQLALALCRSGASRPQDFDSARQHAWALQTVLGDLQRFQPQQPAADAALADLQQGLQLFAASSRRQLERPTEDGSQLLFAELAALSFARRQMYESWSGDEHAVQKIFSALEPAIAALEITVD